MTSTRSEAAWATFWKEGGAGPEGGCLPNALEQIDAAQRRIWREAAQPLRRGGRVLDLATGDGAVLGKILSLRTDLKLVGIDSSTTLPAGPKGATLRAGIAMEQLPFPDRTFDLVTSQFGFEYGDTEAIGREVARVLRLEGAIHFLIHHAEGPIVSHNETRRGSLAWAVVESGLLAKARALVMARVQADLPTPPSFRLAPVEARRRFPGQSAGEEFALAVLQTLELGRRAPPTEALEVLRTLEDKGRNELVRIAALNAAARDAAQIAGLCSELEAAGLKMREPALVRERDGALPFAWHLAGRR